MTTAILGIPSCTSNLCLESTLLIMNQAGCAHLAYFYNFQVILNKSRLPDFTGQLDGAQGGGQEGDRVYISTNVFFLASWQCTGCKFYFLWSGRGQRISKLGEHTAQRMTKKQVLIWWHCSFPMHRAMRSTTSSWLQNTLQPPPEVSVRLQSRWRPMCGEVIAN